VTPGQHVLSALRGVPLVSVLDPAWLSAPPALLDLTASNVDLLDLDPSDPDAMRAYVDHRIAQAGARMAIGRYDEPRIIYASHTLFEGHGEARTVHVGMDLFVPPGTPVRVSLWGAVHSLADNARPGDYGPTVITEHTVQSCTFHLLFGHLGRDLAMRHRPNEPVAAGQQIGRVGTSEENGGWPPHVHVQIIAEIGDAKGDYPGVAAPSERARMLAICPDPSVLLRAS